MTAAIAIIGAGATGATLAIEMCRRLPAGEEVLLIGDAGRPGAGLAYGAARPEHLLNVVAGGLSIDPAHPDDFADWLLARKLPGVRLDDALQRFVPRLWFGEYLADRLDEAAAGGPGRPRVTVVTGRAVSLIPVHDGWRIGLADGGEVAAAQAALCLGNFPGRLPLAGERIAPGVADRIIHDPWRDPRLKEIRPGDDVLALGAGLTMVDLALTREALGHHGRIVAVSRNGLLPAAHVSPRQTPIAPEGLRGGESLAEVMRVARTAAAAHPWRQVVDGLRPVTQAIWTGWSERERRRFQRWLATPWGVARHRMAPEVDARIAGAVVAGRLGVGAARLERLGLAADGRIAAETRLRGGGTDILAVDWVVNCSGPDRDLRRQDDPLLRWLLASGVARTDALRLGLDSDDADRIIDAAGDAWPDLYALGPMTMGRLWEIVAMPDIRVQAQRVADRMANRLAAAAGAAMPAR
ncbi:MAG: FAD/NAD(P)-binding protein [Chloroflexota bacterium]